MKKYSIKNNIFRISAFILSIAVLISLCSCAPIKMKRSVVTLNTISNPSENYEIHCSRASNLQTLPAFKSGFIELYVDTESCSFSVCQTDESIDKPTYWSALPVLSSGEYADSAKAKASVVSIEVLGGTDIYLLNSQDNSVAYGKADYALIENGAVFTYNIFPNKETAEKPKLDKTDIAFCVKLIVTIEDGSMFINCTYENLSGNENACITDLQLLNRFGAYCESDNDDFLFVPDGCGAIIKTAVKDDSFEPLAFPVYGNDISVTSSKGNGTAIVPAFGIKHGAQAFVGLITKGDAVSTIYADKAKDSKDYNFVNCSFTITPYEYDGNNLIISKDSYSSDEGIELCYRFLSGNNASYSGLACACREQLIRNSVLSTRNIDESSNLPFNLTVIATSSEKNIFGKTTIKSNTDSEQAFDMLTRMKNKGINCINMRYIGIFKGGLNQKNIEEITSPILRLGTKKAFKNFFTYIDTQNMNLYFDINILSSSEKFGNSKAAEDISGKALKDEVQNVFSHTYANNEYTVYYRSAGNLKKLPAKILANFRNLNFSGFCINDAGSILYSDYSSGSINRVTSSNSIREAIIPLTINRSTMIRYGNFYTLKNADVVIDLPTTTSVTESGAYQPVPFVQLILHGSVDYSGPAVNRVSNSVETILNYIEYGACPYYEWGYDETDDENDVFYYDDWINSASEYYAKANDVLGSLRSVRIINHSEISDGIFCTEYENGTRVYVNYTDKDYTVSGIVVGAEDFAKVS